MFIYFFIFLPLERGIKFSSHYMLIIMLILFLGSLGLKILIRVMLIKKRIILCYKYIAFEKKEKSKSLWTNTLAKINKLHHKEISG